jgi:hypothetical protein
MYFMLNAAEVYHLYALMGTETENGRGGPPLIFTNWALIQKRERTELGG